MNVRKRRSSGRDFEDHLTIDAKYLKENGVPHTWHVDGNAHDPKHWKSSLYHFLQHVFI